VAEDQRARTAGVRLVNVQPRRPLGGVDETLRRAALRPHR
jgi:hypothetical protein